MLNTEKKSVSNQNKQLVSGTVKEIGQVGGDSVSGLGVKAKNIRRPTSANEVVCEECCCYTHTRHLSSISGWLM